MFLRLARLFQAVVAFFVRASPLARLFLLPADQSPAFVTALAPMAAQCAGSLAGLHQPRRFRDMRRLLPVILVLLPLALPALADEPKPATLTATGEGSAFAVPDIAVVTIGVLSNGRTAQAALSANSTDMQTVIATIKAAGIEDKDIGTSGFNVTPLYPPEREQNSDQQTKIIGYRVSNEVRVTIRDFAKAGGVLDKVVGAGANQVNGISFELSDRAGPTDRALKAAVAEATRKAGIMADAAGLKLVRLISLTTGESRPIPYGPAPSMALAKAAIPIMAGQQEITADVTAVWEIAPK
jgi:uncharacterized protein YggE